MRVAPDETLATQERAAASGILESVLARILTGVPGDARPFHIPSDALTYPGLFAAAYELQAAGRSGPPSPDGVGAAACVDEAVERARISRLRATESGCASWAVDLPPAEEHLHASLARAVAQVPPRPDREQALSLLQIGGWSDDDRRAFCDAARLLAAAWPEMLAELRVVVAQIALIHGYGIDGFTDVATHGAVYVNRARLRSTDAELPGCVRFAEALVHEGAHNRCNAAALVDPFLADSTSGSEPVVMTPLRADPRPLTGLLQQLVVLVRSVLLYDRLGSQPSAAATAAVEARRDKLRRQTSDALRTISAHTAKLTDHGRSVVSEAGALLARSTGELAVT